MCKTVRSPGGPRLWGGGRRLRSGWIEIMSALKRKGLLSNLASAENWTIKLTNCFGLASL